MYWNFLFCIFNVFLFFLRILALNENFLLKFKTDVSSNFNPIFLGTFIYSEMNFIASFQTSWTLNLIWLFQACSLEDRKRDFEKIFAHYDVVSSDFFGFILSLLCSFTTTFITTNWTWFSFTNNVKPEMIFCENESFVEYFSYEMQLYCTTKCLLCSLDIVLMLRSSIFIIKCINQNKS